MTFRLFVHYSPLWDYKRARVLGELPYRGQTYEWCTDVCTGEEGMERCVRLCRDAADLATLHALPGPELRLQRVAGACLCGACKECAEECEQHSDDHCQVCADILRKCTESCHNMMGAQPQRSQNLATVLFLQQICKEESTKTKRKEGRL